VAGDPVAFGIWPFGSLPVVGHCTFTPFAPAPLLSDADVERIAARVAERLKPKRKRRR